MRRPMRTSMLSGKLRVFPCVQQADTYPAVKVSWNDAQTFCAWLTKKELAEGKIKVGQKYRLPTDAEWSVAVGLGKEPGNTPSEKIDYIVDKFAKGVTAKDLAMLRVFPLDKEPRTNGGRNFKGNNRFKYTSPARSFAANRFGLHDLSGNVWEWCEDLYNPAKGNYRVLRGGSFFDQGIWPSVEGGRRTDWISHTRSHLMNKGFRCVLADSSGQ